MNIETKDILIKIFTTPNPYALKCVLNLPVKNKGRATFYSKADCVDLPLFYSLFDIAGLKQIFAFQNQITFTHNGILNITEIEKQISDIIKASMSTHNPDFVSFEEQKEAKVNSAVIPTTAVLKKDKSEFFLQIEQILDRTIRPGLQADGGDLEVLSVENNEVRIAYQGACGGCPSALMGTLEAIENILKIETKNKDLKVIPI